MFRKLLLAMIKEEWRMHTKTAKNQTFAYFPLLIGIGTFVFSLFIPYLLSILTTEQLFRYVHFIFVFFGVSVGAFGLFGKEIMNRRFGQISLLAYSSRALPVSEQKVFLAFFVKDIIYYLFLWILPIFSGFLLASPFIGFSIGTSFIACGSLILSFLLGLSLVFFLSTVYAHSSILLLLLLVGSGVIVAVSTLVYSITLEFFLFPYSLYYSFSWIVLALLLAIITVSSLISVVFVNVEYSSKKKHYRNLLTPWSQRFGFSHYAFYMAKDFIDLKRSEGGLGKVIFSFLLPVFFTYLFLSVFIELIPGIESVMIFAIFLGIVSATIYNMLTEFDSFNPYLFLPVKVSTILRSKINSFLIINIFSVVVLAIAALTMDQIYYFIPALLLFISIAVFMLSVTVYLTGLHPAFLMYDSKVFIPYAGILCPVLFVATLGAIIYPLSMLASPLLLPFAWILFKKSFTKWDQWTPVSI